MPTISTDYQGQLRTEATHLQSGQRLITDAPTDNHGKGESISPTDMLAAALCSCMMTIMGIQAGKRGVEITGLAAETTKVMAQDPRRVGEIQISLRWNNPPDDPELISALKEAALSCPVAMSLHPNLKQSVSFDF